MEKAPYRHEEAAADRLRRGYQSIRLSEGEEAALLQEVYQNLEAIYRPKAALRPPLWRPWILPLGFAGVAAVLVFWLGSTKSRKPFALSPEIQGEVLSAKTPEEPIARLRSAAKAGEIREGQRMRLHLQPATEVALIQPSNDALRVDLQRGSVEADVTPGRYKAFEVRYRGHRVIVRGTRFVVESQGPRFWVRVRQGRVLILSPRQTEASGRLLAAGEEATFDLSPLPAKAVPPASLASAPPKAPRLLLETLRRTAQTAPDRFPADLQTVAKRGDIALSQKGEWLDQIAEELLQQGKKHLAMQAFLALADLAIPDGASANALVQAALLCEETQTPEDTCLSIYKRYIDQYPQGLGYQEALFKYATTLHRRQASQARPWLRLFLRHFPRSRHAPRLRRLLSNP